MNTTVATARGAARTAHLVGLAVNVALAVLKLTIGTIAGSEALVADGFNSAGDVFATAIAFAGFVYASKPADEDHHYGHGNAESLAGLIVGLGLFATGAFIFLSCLWSLTHGVPPPPDQSALWAALATMVTKELLYRYAQRVGLAANSPSLLASARDHRADVLLAGTVALAILAARIGAPIFDPAGAAVVGVYIAVLGLQPIRTNVSTLMDRAPADLRQRVHDAARAETMVLDVEAVRIHPLGSYYMVDLEIGVDGKLSLEVAHTIAHRVGDLVRAAVPHVHDVKVHVNPR
jgi:cation diffusion facilitator family transporter